MMITPSEHRHGTGDLGVVDSPDGRVVYCVVCGEHFWALSVLEERVESLRLKRATDLLAGMRLFKAGAPGIVKSLWNKPKQDKQENAGEKS